MADQVIAADLLGGDAENSGSVTEFGISDH